MYLQYTQWPEVVDFDAFIATPPISRLRGLGSPENPHFTIYGKMLRPAKDVGCSGGMVAPTHHPKGL